MGKVDVHHHLINESGYVDRLLVAMDTFDIDQVALSGLGLRGSTSLGDLSAGNDDVLRAYRRAPERLIPMACVRLDDCTPDELRRLFDAGFRGIKTTRPRHGYDHEAYDRLYAMVEESRVPALFHTGIVLRSLDDRTDDVSSDRMRPSRLDRVARRFPEMTIIMAHLGMPWHDEAAAMIRIHPNVYADLTGATDGWAHRKPPGYFRDLLGWPDTAQKIVFGTDVHVRDLPVAMSQQEHMVAEFAPGPVDADRFWGGTARQWWA